MICAMGVLSTWSLIKSGHNYKILPSKTHSIMKLISFKVLDQNQAKIRFKSVCQSFLYDPIDPLTRHTPSTARFVYV